MRIANGDMGKETERTSRDVEGSGKEGTRETSKVPPKSNRETQSRQ